ncbi:MAG: Fic family protein [Sulfurimonas sp.]|uniref:Fic family protein n=1 Tax=Sulfurimonas sp. TaxID=2022749 RepID=UPI0028CC01A8|nr:Fic family protein [Sulfurimonas sp.]MDT8338264.1 Fic family protein [Sulfurimonas sp.]
MYFTPILPTDMNSNIDEELLWLAEEVCIKSAALGGNHNKIVLKSIKDLLRTTNSYYSNLIESEGTHPLDIEKAMKKDFFDDNRQRNLQFLSIAYINTQKELELMATDVDNIFTKDSVLSIHNNFYTKEGMEPFLDIKHKDSIINMTPGILRDHDVYISKHIAPEYTQLDSMFNEFENQYKSIYNLSTKAKKLLYILSSHHRLTWIHPFLDGNGRVSRLFLDTAFLNVNIEGYGLWNISRGLARDNEGYRKHLRFADMQQQGSTDGRGPLSLRGLKYYLKFMLDTSLDQIKFMNENLQLNSLANKIDKFILLANSGLLGMEPFPESSSIILKELLLKGEVTRGEVKNIIKKSDRTATAIIKTLIERGYIESDTPKGAIRIRFNTTFASYLMPNLIPDKD